MSERNQAFSGGRPSHRSTRFGGAAQSVPDMTVVAEAADGNAGVEMFRQHQPDVTLMDLAPADIGRSGSSSEN